MREPFVQGVALSPSIHQRDAAANFSNRDDADKCESALDRVEVTSNTGGHCSSFLKSGCFLVVQSLRGNSLSLELSNRRVE